MADGRHGADHAGRMHPLYRGAKKRIGSWDGEDEALYGTIDRRLSAAIWASNAILILTYFLLAASYSYGFAIFESTKMLVLFFIAVAALFAVVIETVIIGQKCVDATKMLNPEKKGSFYDIKFQKKWIDSCDEAEKLLIGRCAFKAYAATNKACALLAGALAICALLFNTGFLPSLAVCGTPGPEIPFLNTQKEEQIRGKKRRTLC